MSARKKRMTRRIGHPPVLCLQFEDEKTKKSEMSNRTFPIHRKCFECFVQMHLSQINNRRANERERAVKVTCSGSLSLSLCLRPSFIKKVKVKHILKHPLSQISFPLSISGHFIPSLSLSLSSLSFVGNFFFILEK